MSLFKLYADMLVSALVVFVLFCWYVVTVRRMMVSDYWANRRVVNRRQTRAVRGASAATGFVSGLVATE
ncbi:MAG: hypothetical protein IT445_04350 [Phycisphaeraceae bacterium]|nr:hypothetical protein [Phycisphaeraceae bacterium]